MYTCQTTYYTVHTTKVTNRTSHFRSGYEGDRGVNLREIKSEGTPDTENINPVVSAW